MHFYTYTGIRIVVEHIKKSTHITLHPDATGGVVKKINRSKKKCCTTLLSYLEWVRINPLYL